MHCRLGERWLLRNGKGVNIRLARPTARAHMTATARYPEADMGEDSVLDPPKTKTIMHAFHLNFKWSISFKFCLYDSLVS